MLYQRRKRLIGAIALALAAVCGVLVVCAATSAPNPPKAVEDEFDHIRDARGLFFRPEALDERFPSIADTAYGLAVLKAANLPTEMPRHDEAFASLLSRTIQESPVWGRWYALRIEEATGAALPSDWATPLLHALEPTGVFKDDPRAPDDIAADLAATESALEVVGREKLVLTADQRGSLASWLNGAAAGLTNAYQACNLLRSLQLLGRPDPALASALSARWIASPEHPPDPPNSFEQVLDLYGQACLAVQTPDVDLEPIKRALRPALTRPGADLQITYYVADGWRMLGGSGEDLHQLAALVPERRDAASGLVNAALFRQGSLESSYYVMRIRELRGTPGRDEQLVSGVHAEINRRGASAGLADLLFAAAILQGNDSSDEELQRQAVAAALEQVSRPVTKETVRSWVTFLDLLDKLGVAVPETDVRSWPIVDEGDRIAAWQVIARAAHLRGHTPPAAFDAVAESIPRMLSEATEQISAMELRAGVEALRALGRTDRVPVAVLDKVLASRRGCPQFGGLYRPAAEALVCDLPETFHALSLNVYLEANRGGNR
jgi:hypothetical protein